MEWEYKKEGYEGNRIIWERKYREDQVLRAFD